MPLIDLLRSNPETVSKFTIEQVVSFAGDGRLTDRSLCSEELRDYFSRVPSEKLREYIEYCLSEAFKNGGFVLQDLINELGRRLDFDVEYGLYSGRRGSIGNDGLWIGKNDAPIVVEVKTTDAYRISLDTITRYRDELGARNAWQGRASILIVVGREDTGELEAQVRGSRHAWDIRIISADALLKLVQVKESSDELETLDKIRGVLKPVEYTRLDKLVDVVFSAASDIDEQNEVEEPPVHVAGAVEKRAAEVTSRKELQGKRDAILRAVGTHLGVDLVRKSRATYWSADRETRVACTISKDYGKATRYWYAYHPSWREFLNEGSRSSFVLGCMGRDFAYEVPMSVLENLLPYLNTTESDKGTYWHIHLADNPAGHLSLVVPNRENVDLTEYAVQLS